MDLEIFELKIEGYNPGEGRQGNNLQQVFYAKQDLQSKYLIVAGGNFIDIMYAPVY